MEKQEKPGEKKVDVVKHLQDVIDKATKAGVFDTAVDASTAQNCLNALAARLEELTHQVNQLSNRAGRIPVPLKNAKRK